MKKALFILFIAVWSCQPTLNDTNAVPYDASFDPYLGSWGYTYYTDGKHEDTLVLTKKGDWIQARFGGELIFPEIRGEKLEFRKESEPRQYFSGKVMGNRMWGSLKFEKGEWSKF